MVEMKIGHSGKYPYVKINFSPNEEGEISTKLPMSKMWYKDLIYEIEKVAEEEKKKSEKYLHEDNRKLMIQSFDMYSKLMEISNELRRDMEMGNGAVEHKRVDESLLKREERLRLSLASSGISFWEWFPENGRINFDNRWARVLGFEPGERAFDFQWWEESIHPDCKPVFEKALNDYLEGRYSVYELEYQIKTKTGDWKWIWTAGECVEWDKNKNPVRFLGTHKDITERKQTEDALKISIENLLEEYNQRKILSKRLIDLLEKDRHDIAMEFHDNICQILTSLKINLEIIDDKLKPTGTELGAMIKAARKRAKQAIVDLNIIAQGLMPSILDALGLVPSIRTLFSEFREHTDIKINFFNRNVEKRFDKEKELAIYRIVQEALNNIIKHAEAKNVSVNLLKKGNVLSLSVEDDGVGFDQDKAMKISKGKGPLGLVIMRERAMQLDGELTIESKMGKGTHLLAEIPI